MDEEAITTTGGQEEEDGSHADTARREAIISIDAIVIKNFLRINKSGRGANTRIRPCS